MAATSVDCMYMYDVWALCAVKLDDKASGVNLRGRTSSNRTRVDEVAVKACN